MQSAVLRMRWIISTPPLNRKENHNELSKVRRIDKGQNTSAYSRNRVATAFNMFTQLNTLAKQLKTIYEANKALKTKIPLTEIFHKVRGK